MVLQKQWQTPDVPLKVHKPGLGQVWGPDIGRSPCDTRWLLLGLAVLGTACASVTTSGVNQIRPDAYRISVRAGCASGGIVGAEGIALEEAGGYCRWAGPRDPCGDLRRGPRRLPGHLPLPAAGHPDLRNAVIETQPTGGRPPSRLP